MSITSYIYPVDLYKAAALNAFLQKGYDIDTAVELAKEAAQKMEPTMEDCSWL